LVIIIRLFVVVYVVGFCNRKYGIG